MITSILDARRALPNPSRVEILARLAELAPVPDPCADGFGWSLNLTYDRSSVLSQLPGDDLEAIAASANSDAAACSKSGKARFVLALPTWAAGLVCLLGLEAPLAGIVALAIGSLGMYAGAKRLARSNHDRVLIAEINQLFAAPDPAHHA